MEQRGPLGVEGAGVGGGGGDGDGRLLERMVQGKCRRLEDQMAIVLGAEWDCWERKLGGELGESYIHCAAWVCERPPAPRPPGQISACQDPTVRAGGRRPC